MIQRQKGHKVQSSMLSLPSHLYTVTIRYFDTGILVKQHMTIPKATVNNLQLTNSKDAFLSDTSRSNVHDLHL